MSDALRDVVAVIPARFRSSRFAGKPLVPIKGVPMIERVFWRVAAAVGPENVMVATEDSRIIDFCRTRDIAVVATGDQHPTGSDRVAEVAAKIPARAYLSIQGDEPMVRPSDILSVLDELRSHPGTVCNAMSPIFDAREIESRDTPKMVANSAGFLLYGSRAAIPSSKTGSPAAQAYRQVCIYGFEGRALEDYVRHGRTSPIEQSEDIEILRFLELGWPVRMVTVEGGTLAVDTPDDVERVEAAMSTLEA
jgi:3-deoxy-manno-octulosonate cytidylyltransferase (CMP-KDO synthetase)